MTVMLRALSKIQPLVASIDLLDLRAFLIMRYKTRVQNEGTKRGYKIEFCTPGTSTYPVH